MQTTGRQIGFKGMEWMEWMDGLRERENATGEKREFRFSLSESVMSLLQRRLGWLMSSYWIHCHCKTLGIRKWVQWWAPLSMHSPPPAPRRCGPDSLSPCTTIMCRLLKRPVRFIGYSVGAAKPAPVQCACRPHNMARLQLAALVQPRASLSSAPHPSRPCAHV